MVYVDPPIDTEMKCGGPESAPNNLFTIEIFIRNAEFSFSQKFGKELFAERGANKDLKASFQRYQEKQALFVRGALDAFLQQPSEQPTSRYYVRGYRIGKARADQWDFIESILSK